MATPFKYIVQPGDTLSEITNRINHASKITLSQIEQANPRVNPNRIEVGQILNIPLITIPKSQPHSKPTTIAAENIGYWDWTYYPSQPPEGVTMGIAFSGYVKPEQALENAAKVKDNLAGDKYICLGGGNHNGSFDSDVLTSITTAINGGDFSDYDGIAYDIEVGTEGLSNDFKTSFAAAKAKGFKVLVTISHSAPYGISDGATLMQAFFEDENIDFLSPQLYTSGKEPSNQYAISHGVKWSAYADAKAVILPSIVEPGYYESALSYFQKQGVALKGFIRWNH